jgi:hypothetical protein
MTAAKIRSPSDYRGTVQEAAERVYQLRFDQASPQEVQERWKKLYGFAVAYAREKAGSSPALAAASLERAQQLYDQGQLDAALAAVGTVLQSKPYDTDAMFLQARCLAQQGFLHAARFGLTRVLTVKTGMARAYATRAVVEARIGGIDRAKADMDLAAALEPQAAEAERAHYEKALGEVQAEASADPAKSYEELLKLADSAVNADALVPTAVALVRAENNRRKRWDEIYQDRLRRLEDDARTDPKNAGKLMALGKFLYVESDIPGEQLSPGGTYVPFRFNTPYTREQEILQADKVFDQVLALDPASAEAVAWKASIRLDNNRWEEGEALVNKALSINPELPQILELLSRVLDHTATLKRYQAADLRTPKSWTEFGISYDIIWTHYPTQDELSRASVLQQHANELWAQSVRSLTAAVQKMSGTADGAYYSGLLKSHEGDEQGALGDYQKAVQLDPASNRNRQALIRGLFKLDRLEEAAVEKERWALEHQTTATMRLAKAWGEMDRTAWKSAAAALDAAREIDPADPRVPAYRAVIEAARDKHEDAVRWLVVALAIDAARVKIGFTDIAPDGMGAVWPDAAGLTLLLNLHLAARFDDLHRPDARLATLQRNLALEARIAEGWREVSPPAAVLPIPSDPRSAKPRTISNLLAWSHVLAGYALVDLGKPEQALDQFKQVTNWVKRDSYADAQGLAFSEMQRVYWALNDPDSARRSQWLAKARIMNRLDDEERSLAADLIAQAGARAGMQIDKIQVAQSDLNYWYGAAPAEPGAYDPRQNPNYHGNDDAPPGLIPK